MHNRRAVMIDFVIELLFQCKFYLRSLSSKIKVAGRLKTKDEMRKKRMNGNNALKRRRIKVEGSSERLKKLKC
jgi:hypothetical protein